MTNSILNYIQSPFNAIVSDINFLIFSQIGSQVEQLLGVIDSIPEEQHLLSAESSVYPIETGANLGDNIYVKPTELTLTCYVSKLLISKITTLVTTLRDREAWERLKLLINSRELVTVVTTLTTYENMAVLRISSLRNSNNGSGSLVFDMFLREMLIAETQTTYLPSDQLTNLATNRSSIVNGGLKQSETSTTTQSESWLSSIGEGIGNLI